MNYITYVLDNRFDQFDQIDPKNWLDHQMDICHACPNLVLQL